MGKAGKPAKRGGASSSSSPYDRPSKKQQTTNNIFKFNTSSYGQHILKNPGVAEAIVLKANLKPTDTVLEVGPGSGNLTVRILERAKKVIAVEIDPRMASELTKRVQGKPEQKRLEVILGDVIKMSTLPQFDVCISNTPYQISSPLVFKLLALPNPPRTCILMFQQEFAMRLTARPGDALYCRLSVNAQFFAKITHIMKVGKKNFNPPPQVESSVVRIEPKGADRPKVSWAEWDGMLRVCFNRRNKTLRASWLGTKEVLGMVERNYRLFCSMNDIPLEEGTAGDEEEEAEDDDMEMEMDVDEDETENMAPSAGDEEDEEWGGIMEQDEAVHGDTLSFFQALKAASSEMPKTKSKKKKTRLSLLIREKIRKVLEDDTQLADKRAGKLHENDFLRLLSCFNAENIHFA